MRNLLDLEGPFITGLNKFADIIILNIIYLICCIPVFTIGAATTGLYYVMLKMVKNEECYVVKSFFKSFKDNFKQATIIWLILFLSIIVLFLDLRITNGEVAGTFAFSDSITRVMIVMLLVAMVFWAGVTVYVFPVLSKFDNTTKNTLRNALFMCVRHLPWTILILIINILPWVLVYISPAAVIVLLISFALCAYVCSYIFNKIFINYIPKEETITSDEQFYIEPDQESFLFNNNNSKEEENLTDE